VIATGNPGVLPTHAIDQETSQQHCECQLTLPCSAARLHWASSTVRWVNRPPAGMFGLALGRSTSIRAGMNENGGVG